MLTRRRFLSVAATSAAVLRLPRLSAAEYDLLIKGGRVMDPSRRFDQKGCDVAMKGVIPEGDLMDLANVDVAATRAAIDRHRDVIVGIKARLSKNVAGNNDVKALTLAQQIARPLNIPIMIHMGQTVSSLPEILAVLKPGDIVTHMYA